VGVVDVGDIFFNIFCSVLESIFASHSSNTDGSVLGRASSPKKLLPLSLNPKGFPLHNLGYSKKAGPLNSKISRDIGSIWMSILNHYFGTDGFI